MPQTGPDLVGAGYPISNALTALLGGTGNINEPNVPVKSNLYWGLGNLADNIVGGSVIGGSVIAMAVPVSPGDVFTRMSLLTGATASTVAGSVTNLWCALYTGTGSAPGTTGAQPSLIASGPPGSVGSGGAGSVGIPLSARFDFTFSSPVTITSVQAPYGYVYAAFSLTVSGTASPSTTSFVTMTTAAATEYLYYPTSPYSLCFTGSTSTGSAVPLTLGTGTRIANPPVVFLS